MLFPGKPTAQARRVVLGAVAISLVAAVLALVGFGRISASGPYVGGYTGFDISFPQCGGVYPSTPFNFGIVGVTRGRAFSQNPCLNDEYDWAKGGTIEPSLYMNLQYPIGTTASYGMGEPVNCRKTDKACQAHNYGWNAAEYAFEYAGTSGATSSNWWLDIETGNSWSAKADLNAQVIQGAIDFLRWQGKTVGIYSTKSMWTRIAGAYSPGLPNWVPGASSITTAPSFCATTYAFGGGSVSLVQFPSGGYDALYACP